MQAGTNNVILKPTKFSFPVGIQLLLDLLLKINQSTYFNPQQTVGVGSTGTHYTYLLLVLTHSTNYRK